MPQFVSARATSPQLTTAAGGHLIVMHRLGPSCWLTGLSGWRLWIGSRRAGLPRLPGVERPAACRSTMSKRIDDADHVITAIADVAARVMRRVLGGCSGLPGDSERGYRSC